MVTLLLTLPPAPVALYVYTYVPGVGMYTVPLPDVVTLPWLTLLIVRTTELAFLDPHARVSGWPTTTSGADAVTAIVGAAAVTVAVTGCVTLAVAADAVVTVSFA
jgi:hypothetical protein